MSDDPTAAFFVGASRQLRFNAPLGDERADALVAFLLSEQLDTFVDLGCGRGGLLRAMAEHGPSVAAVGVDTDAVAIADAQLLAEGISANLSFEISDAKNWNATVDAAACIGSSHAFDGADNMLRRMADLVPEGRAVVGDEIWTDEPDDWCRTTFGEMPADLEELQLLATDAGWRINQAGASTLKEWDDFERSWTDAVRNLRLPGVDEFADQRAAEFERYRGVLGFGWLLLER